MLDVILGNMLDIILKWPQLFYNECSLLTRKSDPTALRVSGHFRDDSRAKDWRLLCG